MEKNPSPTNIQYEIDKMTLPDTLISNITSCTNTQHPLSQYAIKASYNSSNSGKLVSTKTIEYILKRGCRFLDFEVYIDDNTPTPVAIIAYSNSKIIDSTNTIKLNSLNTITLDDALLTCITNAFTSNPNIYDPIFIQLRLNTGKSSLKPILDSIKKILLQKLYVDSNNIAIEVNSDTILKDIMGKIILIIDAGIIDISLIKSYVNAFSNTSNWKKYFYRNIDNMYINPPTININSTTETNRNLTSVKDLSMTIPSSYLDTKIPPPSSIFSEYGIQTLLIPFYSINNKNIISYEQLFNTCKGGIVPFSVMISYSIDVLNEK
jgi:hypothetical protein